MKKFVFAFALIMGLNTIVSFADDKVTTTEVSESELQYIPVGFNDLPRNVRDKLALNYPWYVVNSVSVCMTKQKKSIYKVVLLDPENFEYSVYLNDKGEEFDPNIR